ncbi:hypothetical protein EW146_g5281 [Bondarzewia mesenterica]|uniref:Uncharacterized protein n=1 Tax=Bondarzewia mesenterica TaxID=1095465 RepID=A0A4S4LU24_9AGAM|nr:hypothetical protein EW146_g5281 [Bondarzewia mesenterica]
MPNRNYDGRAQYIVSQEPNGSVQCYCRWNGDGNTYRNIYHPPHPSQLSKESALDEALGDEFHLTLAAVEHASITDTVPPPIVATSSQAPLNSPPTTNILVQPVIAASRATAATSPAAVTPFILAADRLTMYASPLIAVTCPITPNTPPTTVMESPSDTAAPLQYRPPDVISWPPSHPGMSLQTIATTLSAEDSREDKDSLAVGGEDDGVRNLFTQDQVHKANNKKSPVGIFEQDDPEAVMETISSSALGLGGIHTIPSHGESGNQNPIQALSYPSPTPSPEAPPPVPLQTEQIAILEVQPPQTVEEMAAAYPYRYCLECKILTAQSLH